MPGTAKQTSRSKPVPDALREYIRLANLLPAPEKPDYPGAELVGEENWGATRDDLENLMCRYPHFRAFFEGVDLPMNSMGLPKNMPCLPHARCDSLKIVRSVLYTIARSHAKNEVPVSVRIGTPTYLDNLVTLRKDAEGILRIQLDPLLPALEGVEAMRIRECGVCGKIFWAGRIDKWCCTTECAHVLRQRRYRENYAARYKLPRYKSVEAAAPNRSETKTLQDERERKRLESMEAPTSRRGVPRLLKPK
jgi:hypothetical protein